MGAELSTARWLAPASFVIDFAAQTYGMLSSPNMKDIHDANISFFSPQPYFIAGFFFPQQMFQLAWLWRLHKAEASEKGVSSMVDFAPFYALGNVRLPTFAGIGVLDLLHNFSAAYFVNAEPSTAVKVATGVGFGLFSAASDWIFGGCLVYDLAALAVGQSMYGNAGWSRLLGIYAGVAAAIVGMRNFFSPPYNMASRGEYQSL
ncbi:hypothetical protein N0V84_004945 [Fusarium piperis]|uniref:Uncharacterized protein n=1 Tax=Fusarium piperis TaxID=1435070 RepID=A0A9W9BR25_9HYPO|nr:hypothetical protein N0V84_004945 [Fusarium piperis]